MEHHHLARHHFLYDKIFNQFPGSGSTGPAAPPPPPGNLVSNPGFEAGDTSGWVCDPNDTVVSSPIHSGSHALQMTDGSITVGMCVQTISVQPNHAYTLTDFAQGSYIVLGASGYSSTYTNSGSFSQLTVTFTTSASAAYVTIYVNGYFSAGNMYVDDVVLSGPGGSPTPTPTTGPTATPTTKPTTTSTVTPTVGPTATPTPTSGNPIANLGFEAGNLSGWTCDTGDVVVTSPVHSGSYAAQITPSGSTTGQCSQAVAVQPNHTYTLSAYVQGNYAYLGIVGGASTWTNSSSYTQLSVSFATGASATSVTIFVHGWYGQADVFVDDVSLR